MRLIDADALKARLDFCTTKGMGGTIAFTFKHMVDEQPTITPEPHWIPVTEDTLPKEGRIVVVYGEKGTWDYGKYRGYGPDIHYWYWKNKTFKKVYWWMYKEDALPEPYNGVTK